MPFEAGATQQGVANQFDWSTLVDRPAALYSRLGLGVSSDIDLCATTEDSGLTEVNGPADIFPVLVSMSLRILNLVQLPKTLN